METKESGKKFGTFAGVFTPTVLTILGAIMYLREGWVVGNAGLLGAFAIIVLANLITVTTSLSISSVATNIRVRAGGAFSIISQSLGLEIGGSVTIPLYLAQAISVAFYLFAFSEGWQRIFPSHPTWLIVLLSFGVAFGIAMLSANLAMRVQFFIMVVIGLSLVSIFLGSFPILGNEGMIHTPQLWGDFQSASFFGVFAIFFPAVTGVLAGVNMSGELKDPRKSLPLGTLAAVALTFVIYMVLAYWLARVATPEELIGTETIMVDKAAWGPIILAGLLAATFSSSLSSLVGASRVLQAIAENEVLPGSKMFGRLAGDGEPRNAMYLTGGITIAAIIFGLAAGGVNAIAPLISMFFLIMYSTLNGVVLLESALGLVSFRPSFAIPKVIPLTGLVGCLFVMFLINPAFSFIAVILIVALYLYLVRRQLVAPWGDVRSGLFVAMAEWAAKRAIVLPISERAWKPSLLVPVNKSAEVLGSYRFLRALAYPRGNINIVGLYPPGEKERLEGIAPFREAFARDGIFTRVSFLETDQPDIGIMNSIELLNSVFFRPNTVFVQVGPETKADTLQKTLGWSLQNRMGAILFSQHPVANLGREQVINVWVREQQNWELGLRLSNLDIALLLAYQLARNWHGQINLITVLQDDSKNEQAETFLDGLMRLGRMPKSTRAIVLKGDFKEQMRLAPQADMNIFGIPAPPDPKAILSLRDAANSSCIFVQDSGDESALA